LTVVAAVVAAVEQMQLAVTVALTVGPWEERSASQRLSEWLLKSRPEPVPRGDEEDQPVIPD